MTNAERLLAAIGRRPGASDGELVAATGVGPHQQVNQICRRLEGQGLVERLVRGDGTIGNYPRGGAEASAPGSSEPTTLHRVGRGLDRPRRIRSTGSSLITRERSVVLPGAHDALILIPCSKAKRPGGSQPTPLVEHSVANLLTAETAERLAGARGEIASKAALDSGKAMSAVDRYAGRLYQSAGRAISDARLDGQQMVILSGGYGLLDPLEAIGMYERAFRRSDWPHGLLESALVEIAASSERSNVVAFCARTTQYAELVRRTRCWRPMKWWK